jgi:PAB1-binding protein PBP1
LVKKIYLNSDSKIKKENRYTDDFETFKKKLAEKEMKIEYDTGVRSQDLASPILDEPNDEWNQFELNKEKFNVDTTYDENKYTTDLNRNEITEERVREVENIEKVKKNIYFKSILRDRSKNRHINEERGLFAEEVDEESKYSSVIRRYIMKIINSPDHEEKPLFTLKFLIKIGVILFVIFFIINKFQSNKLVEDDDENEEEFEE